MCAHTPLALRSPVTNAAPFSPPVQLFAGTFASCSIEYAVPPPPAGFVVPHHFSQTYELNSTLISSREECLAAGGAWENPLWGNFDNILSSALLLFEMSTLEGWTTVMYAGIDATGVDQNPVRDAHPSQVCAQEPRHGFGCFWFHSRGCDRRDRPATRLPLRSPPPRRRHAPNCLSCVSAHHTCHSRSSS